MDILEKFIKENNVLDVYLCSGICYVFIDTNTKKISYYRMIECELKQITMDDFFNGYLPSIKTSEMVKFFEKALMTEEEVIMLLDLANYSSMSILYLFYSLLENNIFSEQFLIKIQNRFASITHTNIKNIKYNFVNLINKYGKKELRPFLIKNKKKLLDTAVFTVWNDL